MSDVGGKLFFGGIFFEEITYLIPLNSLFKSIASYIGCLISLLFCDPLIKSDMGMQHSQFLRCFYALRTLLCVFLFFWMIYFYIYLIHMNDWNKMKWNLLGDVYNFQQATYLFSVFIQRESLQIK